LENHVPQQESRAPQADLEQAVFGEQQDNRLAQPGAVHADEATVVQEPPAEDAQYVETLSAEERRARADRRAAAVAGVPQQRDADGSGVGRRGVAPAQSWLLAESEQQAEAFAAAQRGAAALAESGNHVVVEEPVAVVEEPPLVFQPVPDQPTVVYDGPAVVVEEEVVDFVDAVDAVDAVDVFGGLDAVGGPGAVEGPGAFAARSARPGSFEERAWPAGESEADRTHVGTPPGYGPPPAPSQPWRSSS
jgi:hypothetical protein